MNKKLQRTVYDDGEPTTINTVSHNVSINVELQLREATANSGFCLSDAVASKIRSLIRAELKEQGYEDTGESSLIE